MRVFEAIDGFREETSMIDRVAYRTVWISDTHLGSKGCQAEMLTQFLTRIQCRTLYLVGDIVDFWRFRSRVYWPRNHNDVVRRILKMAKHGTRVIMIPGNHDESLRQYADSELDLGGIVIKLNDVHERVNGQRLLVTHGDQCDLVVTHSRLTAHVGSTLYEHLLVINRHYNRLRAWRGLPYWSLAQHIKLKVKSACTAISRFRATIVAEAERRGLDGVVCGHIHRPEIVLEPFPYFNCGDWIESCSALVEHYDGSIELVAAPGFIAETDALTPVDLEPRPGAEIEETAADSDQENAWPLGVG